MKKIYTLLLLLTTSCLLFSQTEKKVFYYEDGNKREQLKYYNGNLSGKCIAWNDSGTMVAKVYYYSGKKNGKWYFWHNNGEPAYKFYYLENKKVGVWKIYDDNGNLMETKEYEPIYSKKNLLSFGTFTLTDLSVFYARRIDKNKRFSIGGEYCTYVTDGETENFVRIEKFSTHNILGAFGLMDDDWMIFAKLGTSFGTEEQMKFNYGFDLYLSFKDTNAKVIPTYGIGVTKSMGFQSKFGIIF